MSGGLLTLYTEYHKRCLCGRVSMTLNSEEGVLHSDPVQHCCQGACLLSCDTGLDLAVLPATAVYLRPTHLEEDSVTLYCRLCEFFFGPFERLSKTYFMYILDFLFWFKYLMTEDVLISALNFLDLADDCRNSPIPGPFIWAFAAKF